MRGLAPYRLPDGRIVDVDDTAAKGARVISYELKGGRIVSAVRIAELAGIHGYAAIVIRPGQAPSCAHGQADDRWYADGTLCFECWRAEQSKRRAAVRDEVARLLSHGVTLAERWPNGTAIDWCMTPEGETHTVHKASNGDTRHDARPNVYPSTRWNAASLAEHMESRAFGFGFELAAYCLTCGEHTVPVRPSAADSDTPDPTCPACTDRMAERLAEHVNEP